MTKRKLSKEAAQEEKQKEKKSKELQKAIEKIQKRDSKLGISRKYADQLVEAAYAVKR